MAAFTFYILSTFCRIGTSVLIIFLLNAVTDSNYNHAYIYSGLLIVCWFMYQLTNHSGFVVTYQLASKLKSALAMLLYAKISKLTSYVIKNS